MVESFTANSKLRKQGLVNRTMALGLGLLLGAAAQAGPGRYVDLFFVQLKASSDQVCQMDWRLGSDPTLPEPVLRRGASEVGVKPNWETRVLVFEKADDSNLDHRGSWNRNFTQLNGNLDIRSSRHGSLDDMSLSTSRFGTVLQTHSAMTSRGAITRYYGRSPDMRGQRQLSEDEFVLALEQWASYYAEFYCR